jgi:hypothetical protein
VESRVEAIQNARVAMSFMTADLRSACALSKDSPFLGMQRSVGDVQADNIDFATRNYTPKRRHEGDYCQVSYFLQKESATGKFGLWRRRNPTNSPDPLAGGRKEEIARDVKGLRLQYYDGLEWYDQWGDVDAPKRGRQKGGRQQEQNSRADAGNLSGMPEAVRITLYIDLGAKPKEAEKAETPMAFQTVVRLNLAAAQRLSSSPSQTGGDTPGNQENRRSPGGGN